MKNKNMKIMLVIIGILILIISIFYRNNYIVKNNKQIIKEMDESTQVTSLNNTINELNKTHEEYQTYIQNCKAQIARAISENGIETSEEDTLETMATNIKSIVTNSDMNFQYGTSNATITLEKDCNTIYVGSNCGAWAVSVSTNGIEDTTEYSIGFNNNGWGFFLRKFTGSFEKGSNINITVYDNTRGWAIIY